MSSDHSRPSPSTLGRDMTQPTSSRLQNAPPTRVADLSQTHYDIPKFSLSTPDSSNHPPKPTENLWTSPTPPSVPLSAAIIQHRPTCLPSSGSTDFPTLARSEEIPEGNFDFLDAFNEKLVDVNDELRGKVTRLENTLKELKESLRHQLDIVAKKDRHLIQLGAEVDWLRRDTTEGLARKDLEIGRLRELLEDRGSILGLRGRAPEATGDLDNCARPDTSSSITPHRLALDVGLTDNEKMILHLQSTNSAFAEHRDEIIVLANKYRAERDVLHRRLEELSRHETDSSHQNGANTGRSREGQVQPLIRGWS